MSQALQYLTDANGQRIGVVLELDEYRALTSGHSSDPELLIGLSQEELEALAESRLAPTEQALLDDLLARGQDNSLTSDESALLDRLLGSVDQLTVLKTRAKYTMRHNLAAPAGTCECLHFCSASE
ncbi:MAG: hypothetical protein QF437_29615 [Planctomycetota bacterium]|jgi:hypothetical protein|nr:hypothetical protein [Planctomycetota bacterium]MDP7250937.1 hypothetical protein [Planctomycetota bacterium]